MEPVIPRIRIAALLAGALLLTNACGPEKADEIVGSPRPALPAPGTARVEFFPALPAPGTARVEFSNGRVSVLSNGALRLEILEQLAEKVGFDLLTGDLEPRLLTVRIEGASLGEAFGVLLAGMRYNLEYDLEPEGSNIPVLLTVGHAVSIVTAPQAEAERWDEEPQLEGAQKESAQRYLENVRQRVEARSPEERQRMREERAARAEAREPELLDQLDDLDPDVRADAVAHLPIEGEGAIGAERLQRLASLVVDDPDRRVRIATVERLAEVQSSGAVNALVKALADPDREVVLAAIEALEDVDDISAIPYLEPLLQNSDHEIRENAEFAIEYIQW